MATVRLGTYTDSGGQLVTLYFDQDTGELIEEGGDILSLQADQAEARQWVEAHIRQTIEGN